jgi:hypothetical protein
LLSSRPAKVFYKPQKITEQTVCKAPHPHGKQQKNTILRELFEEKAISMPLGENIHFAG